MGGRGRWSGGVSSQRSDSPGSGGKMEGTDAERSRSGRTWEQEQDDMFNDILNSQDKSDFFENNDGDQVFKWVGMSHDEAKSYFESEIKPTLLMYEDDNGLFASMSLSDRYSSAIQQIDQYIIDDYQLGSQVQDYRSQLEHKYNISVGSDSSSYGSEGIDTTHHVERFDSPAIGLTVITKAGKEGVVVSQRDNISVVRFPSGAQCACNTNNLSVTQA